MKVYPDQVIESGYNYKMEIYFEGMTWYNYAWFTQRILWLLDGMSIGANWISGSDDTWYLFYHLKASGATVTHSQIFDTVNTVYERAVLVENIDLEEREPLFEPDTPLPEVISKNWKWLVAIVITVLVLLVILPYGYKKGTS